METLGPAAFQQVEPIAVGLLELCRRAALHPDLAKAVSEEQLEEAMGGISNLYCGIAFARKEEEFTVQTELAFASELVSQKEIATEIQYCIGQGVDGLEILRCLASVLGGFAVSSGNERPVELRCLGIFTPVNLVAATYLFRFRHPSSNGFARKISA